MGRYKKYTDEFKRDVLTMLTEGSVAQIERDLDLTPGLIYKWQQRYRATGAPHIVIYRPDLEAVLQHLQSRPLVMIDIAVPCDVEATVRDLSDVQVHDIDDLHSVVDTSVELCKAAIPQVETIIQEEMVRFTEWYHNRPVTPVIKILRE